MTRSTIFLAIACFAIGFFLQPVACDRESSFRATIEGLNDSLHMMYVHDSIRVQRDKVIDKQHYEDSIVKAAIDKQLSSVPETLTNIKNHYNEKRASVINLPIDGRIQFLADWLSKESSKRR